MKKVVYSVSRFNKSGNNKLTGIGFITDKDLIIACVSQKGNAYIRVFEDCIKNCHSIPNRDGEYKGAHYEIRERLSKMARYPHRTICRTKSHRAGQQRSGTYQKTCRRGTKIYAVAAQQTERLYLRDRTNARRSDT